MLKHKLQCVVQSLVKNVARGGIYVERVGQTGLVHLQHMTANRSRAVIAIPVQVHAVECQCVDLSLRKPKLTKLCSELRKRLVADL